MTKMNWDRVNKENQEKRGGTGKPKKKKKKKILSPGEKKKQAREFLVQEVLYEQHQQWKRNDAELSWKDEMLYRTRVQFMSIEQLTDELARLAHERNAARLLLAEKKGLACCPYCGAEMRHGRLPKHVEVHRKRRAKLQGIKP